MKKSLHPISLSFTGQWSFLEEDFKNKNTSESLPRIRLALILAILLYAIFGLLDLRLVPEIREIFWFIRYILIIPASLFILYLTYKPLFLKWSQGFLIFVCYYGALGIIAMAAIADLSGTNGYYIGLILIFITIHNFLQIRFLWASFCTLAIVISYEVISYIFIKPERLVQMNIHFFFFSSALLCMAAGYINEKNLRHNYLLEYLFKKEQEKTIKQKHKMELLGTISSGVAHDFNNMLTSLQGYTELSLNETNKDSPAFSYQNEVLRVTQRAQKMTQEILSFSRTETEEKKIVNVKNIFSEVEKHITPFMDKSIHFSWQDNSTGIVTSDEHQLHRILINLCTNAIQAMENTGGELSLAGDDSPEGDLIIIIKDNGPGISKEVQKKIFESYFTTKKEGKGTGLGLFIVKEKVHLLGGTISLNSTPGEGTEFILSFPPTN
jgi:signal transduction histidine kinase